MVHKIKISNIPEKELKSLFLKAYENAKEFAEDAKLLLTRKSYGHAYGLSVLGLEELGKSSVLIVKYMEPNYEIPDLKSDNIFSKHVDKQIMATGILALFEYIRFISAKDNEEKTSIFNKLLKIQEMFDKNSSYFQHTKHSGLYVDYRKGKIYTPKDMTTEIEEEILNYCKIILDLENFVRHVFETPKSQFKMELDQLVKIGELLERLNMD